MGKQCRRGQVIMSPGHKWDNSGYYNHTGERHSLLSPCTSTTVEAHPFPSGAMPVTEVSQRTLQKATVASDPQAANLLCPQDAARLIVLTTDTLGNPAQAVLYTSLLLN